MPKFQHVYYSLPQAVVKLPQVELAFEIASALQTGNFFRLQRLCRQAPSAYGYYLDVGINVNCSENVGCVQSRLLCSAVQRLSVPSVTNNTGQ